MSDSMEVERGPEKPHSEASFRGLFEAVLHNDRTAAEKNLEQITQETLANTLLCPKTGCKNGSNKSFVSTGLSSSAEWMSYPCMPWNPHREEDIGPFSLLFYRCTLLHLAAVLGHAQLCRVFLDKGADVSVTDSCANPVILFAAASGDVETVKTVIEAGGRVSQVSGRDVSALHVACKQGNPQVVQILLQQPDVDVNKKSFFVDEIPLFCAAYYGHVSVAKLLLDNGADVNKTTECQLTAVHMAARKSNTDMIHLLAERGADLNVSALVKQETLDELRFVFDTRHIFESPALTFAVASSEDDKCVRALLSHGANVNADMSFRPFSPLMLAVKDCKLDIVRVLLEAGIEVNRPTVGLYSAVSPLIAAIAGFHPGGWQILEAKVLECVQLLVEAGASMKKDHGRTSCMHACVYTELREVFAYLVEKGADPYENDCYGICAVELCLRGVYGNARHWMMKCLQAGLMSRALLFKKRFHSKLLNNVVKSCDINMIKMFEAAGLLNNQLMSEKKVFHNDVDKETAAYFNSAVGKVSSLQNLSRRAVSEAIGARPGRCASIKVLPLPEVIKSFLMYNDLLPLLEPLPSRFIKLFGQTFDDTPVHSRKEPIRYEQLETYESDMSDSEFEEFGNDSSFDLPWSVSEEEDSHEEDSDFDDDDEF